ncbi:MAG TPA: ABC transporter permease subunit [Candidatus Limnocylindrales bacterium]|nr:ABC transporter permease subunit [Candidatus Limnocylindrales bacterium]
MPYFVEYLRATRALRIVGIILGVMLIVGVCFRLYFINGTTPEAYVSSIENSPTAHVTRTQLPDGGTQAVVDDPKRQLHAVIVHHGRSFQMKLSERGAPQGMHNHVSMGNTSTERRTHDGVTTTEMSYEPGSQMQWGILFLISAGMGLLVATILGGPLAKENDGHLELAWTKPISREAYALSAVAVDGLAIVASQLLTIVLILMTTAMWTTPTLHLEDGGGWRIALGLLAPMAWYAFLTTVTASLKRGPGTAIGVAWVLAIIVPALGGQIAEHADAATLLQALHPITATLTYLDPIAYIWFPRNLDLARFAGQGANTAAWLVGLLVAYVALAVAQWHRAEA